MKNTQIFEEYPAPKKGRGCRAAVFNHEKKRMENCNCPGFGEVWNIPYCEGHYKVRKNLVIGSQVACHEI